jgi:Cu(I)/Ag(I) efflux system membrane fusion protein
MKNLILAGVLILPFAFAGCSKDERHAAMPQAKISKYHCPMHPTYIKDGPSECAICGMDLVPIEEGAEGEGIEEVEGYATVKIDPRRRQLIGLKTEETSLMRMVKTVRTVGRIAYDPELYRTQEEFLTALSSYKRIQGSSSAEAVSRAKSLLDSSRLRLRIMGLSNSEIDKLASRGNPERGLLLAQGKGAKPWMYADVYESDLELIREGLEVEAHSTAIPGESFKGIVGSIDPNVNPKTRSVRIRVRLDDPEGLLKPDMYLNAAIEADLGMRTAIPDTAVIDTGVQQVVFVDTGDGHIEPREVLLGVRADGQVEVREGLEDGDLVVTSGNFLIDSESKLKAVIASMTTKSAGRDEAKEAADQENPHAGHTGH